MQFVVIQGAIGPSNFYRLLNKKKGAISSLFYYNSQIGGYRIMAIIRGFQPFDESSILSTRSNILFTL